MAIESRKQPPVTILCGGCNAAIDVDPYMLDQPLACVHCNTPIIVKLYDDLVAAKKEVAAERRAAVAAEQRANAKLCDDLIAARAKIRAGKWPARSRRLAAFGIAILTINAIGWVIVATYYRRAAVATESQVRLAEASIGASESARIAAEKYVEERNERREAALQKAKRELQFKVAARLLVCHNNADQDRIAKAIDLVWAFLKDIPELTVDEAVAYAVAAVSDPEDWGFNLRNLSTGVRLLQGKFLPDPGIRLGESECDHLVTQLHYAAFLDSTNGDWARAEGKWGFSPGTPP